MSELSTIRKDIEFKLLLPYKIGVNGIYNSSLLELILIISGIYFNSRK